MKKNNIPKIEKILQDKKTKTIALLAPSFVVSFQYPDIIWQLKKLGFDKVTEITFGAKMINKEYHNLLSKTNDFIITSPCPGIVSTIQNKLPQYKKNLAKIDSPVEAMAKISKKHFPKYKTIFLSPCDFKKIETAKSKYIDYVIDYEQLNELFEKHEIGRPHEHKKYHFDKFYNDYTKIFPISGGLAKTAHLKKVIKKNEIKTTDGIMETIKFLEKPDPKVRFLDCLFCVGGCINGPHTNKKLSIKQKRNKVLNYLKQAKKEDISEIKKGTIKQAKGIKFNSY